MMSSPSSEEVNAQRSDFGLRLSNSMAKYGPLCVGIDPHRQLLTDWGYNVDALGAELYSMRMLQAANGRAAAVKFQFSMFERYGSKGIAALERVLYAARQMGVITIVDCLHGGLPTTISAFADAYFKPGAPLLADAITLLPYYGARSLGGVINDALNNGRGVFIASLTSNQEGASLQTAIRQAGEYKGKTVAYGIASTAQKFNKGNDERFGRRPGQVHRTDSFPRLRMAGSGDTRSEDRVQRHQGQCAGYGISFHRHARSRHRKIDRSHRVGRRGYSAGIDRGSKRKRR